ncbi:MAG: VWA domain-containing protein [Prevotellaceae bacterium]|jgi:Ca-activated chloride channel family protein|nr:VWA domain-containing protein [Prevotellaceae bacterium]
MFHFANTYFLWLLLVIPLLIVVYLYGINKQKKRIKEFGNPEILAQLMPNVSKYRPHVKFSLSLLVIALLIVALARPQYLHKVESVQKRGIEAMFVLDISNSMLTQDIEPNRLEYAKLMLSNLIEKMTNDKIGLIVFAGDSYIQMPITSDNVSAKMFLKTISPSIIQRQGTAIGSAIDLAIKCFGEEKNNVGRAIFLITDGENHEDDAVEAAKLAQKKGIIANVIGIGNPDGSPIPVQGTMSFIKDKDGNVVVSKLNEEMCRQIASAGKGIYIHATNSGAALKTLEKEVDKMQKGDTKLASTDYDDKFQIPVWLALFTLLIEYFMFNRQNKRLNRINLFGKKL